MMHIKKPTEASPLVTIEEIHSLIERKHPIKFAIDKPKAGTTSDIYAFTVSGWVTSNNVRAVSVEIVLYGRVIRKAKVDITRSDVFRVFPKFRNARSSGFNAEIGVLGLPLKFNLQIRAVLDTEQRIPLCEIQGSRRPITLQSFSSLNPLLLVSTGRTGTTWTMRLLSQHPSIVTYCKYPYETRVAQYWIHMLKTLSEPADYLDSAVPSTFFTNPSWVGKNPFYKLNSDSNEFLGRGYVEDFSYFCRESTNKFYSHVADLQGKKNPIYFMEKVVISNFSYKLFYELYPKGKEVLLVRDLRDVFCSILAFNNKRGYLDFGQQNSKTEEGLIWNLKNGADLLSRIWRENSERAYFLRYEDIILNPVETLTKLLSYLELDSSREIIRAMIKEASIDTQDLERHRTSSTSKSSIGRWRRDLTPQLQSICNEAFECFLKEFGYTT